MTEFEATAGSASQKGARARKKPEVIINQIGPGAMVEAMPDGPAEIRAAPLYRETR